MNCVKAGVGGAAGRTAPSVIAANIRTAAIARCRTIEILSIDTPPVNA